MAPQLAALQIHLWVLTGVVCLLIVGNVLCNLRSSKRNDYKKLNGLWESEKLEELLAYTNVQLRRSPASSMHLMYKTMALLKLLRLDEAEATAAKFKDAAPNMRSEALSLVGSIAELRERLG